MMNIGELEEILRTKKADFRELESLDECGTLAHALTDIVEAAQAIKGIIESKEEMLKEDSLYDIKFHITHICYHLLDSKLLSTLLSSEIMGNPDFMVPKSSDS